jgi:hypothetical protein
VRDIERDLVEFNVGLITVKLNSVCFICFPRRQMPIINVTKDDVRRFPRVI